MNNAEDIFRSMNASRILVAILEKLGSISVPAEIFMNANNSDRELAVSYNDEAQSFEFSLREQGEQKDYELVND